MKKISLVAIAILIALCSTAQTTLPPAIIFERTVMQVMNDETGKTTATYYFTINGDYALAKHEASDDDENAMILYTKDGKMCMIDEKAKTITILNMPKVVGEAAGLGKEIGEKIKKAPLEKGKKDDMAVTKTGKTKTICGYTAYEFQVKNEAGSMSWWYAKVDFNPIKIYTMGIGKTPIAGSKADVLKNNPAAIPILNQNYLWVEMNVSGKKALETESITKTSFIFSTVGYTVKDFGKKSLKDIINAKLKKQE